MMFIPILKFELKYWFKNISTYIYIVVLFLFALLSMAGSAGIFGEDSTGNSIANSPLSLYSFIVFFNKILLYLLPAIIGYSVFRDFKDNVQNILFTFPVPKIGYLSGKFLSSFIVTLIIALFMLLGLIAGTLMPGVNSSLLIPFDPTVYFQLFIIYLLPNILLTSLIVFGVVIYTKNLYAGFISVIVIFILRDIILRLFAGIDQYITVSLSDPFGVTGTSYFLKNLSVQEYNFTPIPIESLIIINRIIWLSVAGIISFFIYMKFEFKLNVRRGKFKFRAAKQKPEFADLKNSVSEYTPISYKYDLKHKMKTILYLSRTDLKYIVTSGPFIIILLAGIILISVILLQIDPQTETKLLPVTYRILGIPVFFFSFVILGLTFLYSGILINRPKTSGTDDLINVTAVPNSVLYFSKLIALVMMQVILLITIMLTGISIQIYSGYFNIDIGLYLFDLFIINLTGFIIWAIASIFIQSIFSNTFSGLFFLILIAFGIGNLDSLEIQTPLLMFNKNPDTDMIFKYSDMNGYGHSVTPFFIYKSYWSIFALILCFLTLIVWQRKITQTFSERAVIMRKRFKGITAIITVGLILSFTSYGLLIFREENKPLNKKNSQNENEINLKQFQEKFSKYKNIKQPRIESAYVNMNIFPEENNFYADGYYILVNKTNEVVNTILLKTGYDEVTSISFQEEVSKLGEDSIFNFTVYNLRKGILPKDSLRLNFIIKNKPNTLLTQNSNVLDNGTFIKQDIFPRLGYFAVIEKSMPEDSSGLKNHYQSIDADLVELEFIVSTSSGQTAIAPGKLLKEWSENGRSYFHYKPEQKIKFVFGFNSGIYEFISEDYKGKEIGIYYDKIHDQNIENLMDGLKASLDYNTTNFGNYQHSQAYIVEFPRSEGTYATTAANIIPTSEVRFIIDTENANEDAIDISYYVAAHELTHQWWGNQIIPADVQGAHFITESIAEYITAKIYEKKYGKKMAMKFLNIQLNRYLNGRNSESGEEMPLIYVKPEQSYISYGKGAVALYTLSEYIGEENLNNALKDYFENYMYKGPPYTTSLDLLNYIYKNTPESKHYLIKDMFETTDPEKLKEYFESLISLGN